MSEKLIIVLLLVGGVLVWAVLAYNQLVALRNRFQNAFAQIDVQLKRRYELIPNLVESAKAYMAHERGALQEVIAARNSADAARQSASTQPESVQAVRDDLDGLRRRIEEQSASIATSDRARAQLVTALEEQAASHAAALQRQAAELGAEKENATAETIAHCDAVMAALAADAMRRPYRTAAEGSDDRAKRAAGSCARVPPA